MVCAHSRNSVFSLLTVLPENRCFCVVMGLSPMYFMCSCQVLTDSPGGLCLPRVRCSKHLAHVHWSTVFLTLYYKQGQSPRDVKELMVSCQAGAQVRPLSTKGRPLQPILSEWKFFTYLYKISFESSWMHFTSSWDFFSLCSHLIIQIPYKPLIC